MNDLDSLVARLSSESPEQLKKLSNDIGKKNTKKIFIPSPGPQTDAYFSKADILLFGGNPGGGKTALEVGLALNEHHRALILRKKFTDLEAPIHTLENILNDAGVGTDGLVGGQRPKYHKPDGGVINLMGLGDDFDGKQGNPHDLICFDEAAQFPENYVRMVIGWLRTNKEGQRCRVVLGSNPPINSVGDWLISFFAPWLDERHPNPAKPGELRWFNPSNNDECDEHDRFLIAGIECGAQSRTYIPSSFTDNPYYNPEEYAKQLASLPDSVRERLMSGNFMLARDDNEWQCIPTQWVKLAQERWKANGRPVNVPMCALAVDIAQGGADQTILSPRYDGWFDNLLVVPGAKTPDGPSVAGLVVQKRRDGATVIIDYGGGYGGDAGTQLKQNGIEVVKHKGAEASTARTRDRALTFTNKRTEIYWRLREALDPSQDGGSPIMLPDDPELLADLTSPTYEVTGAGIKLEPKDKLKARIGRSPDKGDAVAMCWAYGRKVQNIQGGWENYSSNRAARPKAVMGHEHKRRTRR